jgi:hypothetical protein
MSFFYAPAFTMQDMVQLQLLSVSSFFLSDKCPSVLANTLLCYRIRPMFRADTIAGDNNIVKNYRKTKLFGVENLYHLCLFTKLVMIMKSENTTIISFLRMRMAAGGCAGC